MVYSKYIIGIDFDNTIINYDDIIYEKAFKFEYITANIEKNKKQIRDHIRSLHDGEIKWQKLQAIIYGAGIKDANLIDGVRQFFIECQKKNICVYIISHKTENLRHYAWNWLSDKDFFSSNILRKENVFFESTRQEKIDRMSMVRCTYFIDDLEEIFLEKIFPENIEKILYAPDDRTIAAQNIKVVRSWYEIIDYFFDVQN